jgi:hypothetical protein
LNASSFRQLSLIFNKWGYARITRSNNRKTKRVNGKMIDITDYELQSTFKEINPLLEEENIWNHIISHSEKRQHRKLSC